MMSVEATMAVMEHATGTDAEWRMLMLLAGDANARGVVTGFSMATLAKRMDKSERGVAGVKGRLKKSGQLVVLDEGGGRGRPAVYWIKLPGLDGPETPQEAVESRQPDSGKDGDTPQPDAPNGTPPLSIGEQQEVGGGRSSARAGRPPGMKAAAWQEFWLAIGGQLDPDLDADPLEPDAEMVVDGLELLRQGRKVDGKVVTAHEMALAAVALATFNRCFEWQGKSGSSFGLGSALIEIVMRIRDRPSWDAAAHVRLVESAWRVRWWEKKAGGRRPSPPVIWSPKSFDQVVQDAADEKKARDEGKPQAAGRRYTRG